MRIILILVITLLSVNTYSCSDGKYVFEVQIKSPVKKNKKIEFVKGWVPFPESYDVNSYNFDAIKVKRKTNELVSMIFQYDAHGESYAHEYKSVAKKEFIETISEQTTGLKGIKILIIKDGVNICTKNLKVEVAD